MDEERLLNDAQIDAIEDELRRALDVAPSPQFVARVRLRVAEDRIVPSWRALPLAPLAAVALLAAIASVVVSDLSFEHREPAAASTQALPSVSNVEATPAETVVSHVTTTTRKRPAVAPRPLTVLSKTEIEWYRSLSEAANEGRLTLAELAEPVAEPEAASVPLNVSNEEIELPKLLIDEIIIDPITQ
jgi:hypothetical protein